MNQPMALTQTLIYKTTAESQLHIDLHWIPGQEKRPVLFWLHGGALIFGSRSAINPEQLATYLSAGYIVAAADYRLAPETKLPSIIEDVQDAYRWLHEIGPTLAPIDAERIGVIGHSAGGYLTLMTGFCVEPRPLTLVSFYGYGDIIAGWYSQPDAFYRQTPLVSASEAYGGVGNAGITGASFDGPLAAGRWRFYLYCRQNGLWPQEVGGHDPFHEVDWFRPYCPVENVTGHYPPTLFAHGDNDTDVPVSQSIQMADVLEGQGVEHELCILPGEPHGFDHKGFADPVVNNVFHRVLGFLDRYLKV